MATGEIAVAIVKLVLRDELVVASLFLSLSLFCGKAHRRKPLDQVNRDTYEAQSLFAAFLSSPLPLSLFLFFFLSEN